MPAQQKTTHANTAMKRRDVVHLLQEGGNPAQVDVSHHDVRGITLLNGNLRGANLSQARVCEANLCGADLSNTDVHGADLSGTDLSWACFGEASDDEQLKHRPWRRGVSSEKRPMCASQGVS